MEWRQVTRIHVALHQSLDASQPFARRANLAESGRRIVGEDAPVLGRMLFRQVVGAAGKFFARLRL